MNDEEIRAAIREGVSEAIKPSETRLKEEFAERFGQIVGRGSMQRLRDLQSEYMEKGLSESDVDVSPKGSVKDERQNRMPGRAF